jgi:hypothetical protein
MKTESKKNGVFLLPMRSEDEILARHRARVRRVKCNWGYVIGGLLVVAMVLLALKTSMSDTVEGVALLNILFSSILLGTNWLDAYFFWPETAWVRESDWDELATLCENTPGLIPFRDAIRASGRRFGYEEAEAMVTWAESQPRGKADPVRAYERLYGRPVISMTETIN